MVRVRFAASDDSSNVCEDFGIFLEGGGETGHDRCVSTVQNHTRRSKKQGMCLGRRSAAVESWLKGAAIRET